ncbi:MAG: gluconate 2-dehydrogenase subunit 3 family protein [Balneolaceae bacterium]
MDRREHLKLLFAGSIGTGFMITSCTDEDREISEKIIEENGSSYGRTEQESLRDEKLHADTFFTDAERKTVESLSDLIIPADDISGSATDAGVPDFIDFMMKDVPGMQLPVRGGLMWLDNQSRQNFGKIFTECSPAEQKELLDKFVYPDKADPNMGYGVRFFNRMRNLTVTGFYTSEMGFKDLGYMGNTPNVWDGVPEDVLKKHGFSYGKKTLEECVKPAERGMVAEWDDEGNLIRDKG